MKAIYFVILRDLLKYNSWPIANKLLVVQYKAMTAGNPLEMKNIITNIERIADHATNIAEASIYSLQGTDIRHSGLDSNMTIHNENN